MLLLLALPLAAAQAPRGELAKDRGPRAVVERWTEDYRRLGGALHADEDSKLLAALDALNDALRAVAADENAALLALCDLAAVAGHGSAAAVASGRYVPEPREAHVRERARAVLSAALDAPCGQGRAHWLATTVLADSAAPLGRRIAVADALARRHWEPLLLPLLSAGTAPERGLREAAVRALAGWQVEAVDRFLGQLALRALRDPDYLALDPVLLHFERRDLPVGSPAAVELAGALALAMIAPDWRTAVRRIPLSRVLPNDLAVPHLIEALAVWCRRGAAGASSRRVEALLVRELERRSGLQLGMVAERWTVWWRATREKDADAGARREAPPPEGGRTKASFFGLHPWTDRVVFVIDRSGSMADKFGTTGASRYAEALRQLELLLRQLGPRAHFDLVLFSDVPRTWAGDLRPATPAAIDAVLRWARGSPPKGGTHLLPAVRQVLEIDARGQPDLEALEADTVIVLCDGATAEGAAWVAPLLDAVREPTCVRFDCVQVGQGGNGTLEALAEGSGGQFVRVDP